MQEFIYSTPIDTIAAQAHVMHNDRPVCITYFGSKVLLNVCKLYWLQPLSADQSPDPPRQDIRTELIFQLIWGSLIMWCSFVNSLSYFVRLWEFHHNLLKIQLSLCHNLSSLDSYLKTPWKTECILPSFSSKRNTNSLTNIYLLFKHPVIMITNST